MRDRTLLGRVGQPEHVANVALFLAFDERSYGTGIDLVVDGGMKVWCHPQPTETESSMSSLGRSAVPTAQRRRHGSGFWAVAFAFLIVMSFATMPSPLYGLCRMRDHLSALTITVVFAIFAAAPSPRCARTPSSRRGSAGAG
jgi:Enoyl-(Acyl carrier protein) reductase